MFPDLGSQYEFIKELGSGGTGVVNLAVDRDSGFLVAIKTLFDFHIPYLIFILMMKKY